MAASPSSLASSTPSSPARKRDTCSIAVSISEPAEEYVRNLDWRGEFKGDVAAFTYPSLREQDALDIEYSRLHWNKSESRAPHPTPTAAERLEATTDVGEECLRVSPTKRRERQAHRNREFEAGRRPQNLLDHSRGMRGETQEMYLELLAGRGAPRPSKFDRAKEKLLFMTDEERLSLHLRPHASSVLAQIGTHEKLALEVWRRRHFERHALASRAVAFMQQGVAKRKTRIATEAAQKWQNGGEGGGADLIDVEALARGEPRKQFFSTFKAISLAQHKTVQPDMEGEDSAAVLANRRFLVAASARKLPPEPSLLRRQGEKLDLSNFSLGDDLGHALCTSLPNVEGLKVLNLSGNRLSPSGVDELLRALAERGEVTSLDLSNNKYLASGQVAAADSPAGFHRLASLLHASPPRNPTGLTRLALSHTNIAEAEIDVLMLALKKGPSQLHTLDLSHNRIGAEGGEAIAEMIGQHDCAVTDLDLSWNHINGRGAEELGNALQWNKSLTMLSLAFNDFAMGGQQVGQGLLENKALTKLDFSRCQVSGHAALVLSRALRTNTKSALRELKLDGNPLGENGGAELVRYICTAGDEGAGRVHRIAQPVQVSMLHCSFRDDKVFDRTLPGASNPFALDLLKPYDRAVLGELLELIEDAPGSALRDVSLVQAKKRSRVANIADAGWTPPASGTLEFTFEHKFHVPTESDSITPSGIAAVMGLLCSTEVLMERKQLLHLVCKAFFFFTAQAQLLVDTLANKALHKVGRLLSSADGLGDDEAAATTTMEPVEVISSVFPQILDSERVFDFVHANLSNAEIEALITTVGPGVYKYAKNNPSGRWVFDLSRMLDRRILMLIAAENERQSTLGKKSSGRSDTSQHQNWTNFRNATLNREELVLTRAFFEDLPSWGFLQFDFVSTVRPPPDTLPMQELTVDALLLRVGYKVNIGEEGRPDMSLAALLLNFHLLSSMYYFNCGQLVAILDKFKEPYAQVEVAVSCFCRIVDLEHFEDSLLRVLPQSMYRQALTRLGWLNVWNPQLPYMPYELSLEAADERAMVKLILSMASKTGDSITEDYKRTDIPMHKLYASATLPKEGRLFFTYEPRSTDEAVQKKVWESNSTLLKSVLLGTQPLREELKVFTPHLKERKASRKISGAVVPMSK